MASKSFASRTTNAQLMASGMDSNVEVANSRGWDSEKNEKLKEKRERVINLNDEQEKLKSELKMKTAALNAQMAELQTMMIEATKVVKLGFPQEQWKEFGINAKR
jgi:hypothetical protein